MKTYAKYVFTPLLGLLLLAPASFAQDDPATAETPEAQPYTQPELDQLLAPIALYPDSLLSQILMASTYPLEIVEAARWSRANPGFEGEAAVRMVEDRDWDPSVKSLVAFPKILEMMDKDLDWTQRLSSAYLSLPEQVMDTVQGLRRKADAAGNLKSNNHYRVEQEDGNITIEPQNPEIVYVPYYDSRIVYGPWGWPAYPPVYWDPWPGYYAYPGFSGFYWSLGIFVGPRFFFGVANWPIRHVTVVKTLPFFVHHVHHKPIGLHRVWVHDPRHRRGVAFRHPFRGSKIVRSFKGSEPKFHGKFPIHHRTTRAPRFESRDDTRFKSRFEQGKHSSADSRKFDPRSKDRHGMRRGDASKFGPGDQIKQDHRRMSHSYTGVRSSGIGTSNDRRKFERKWEGRRGESWGNRTRGSVNRGGFSARGRTPGVRNTPASSFSSKKSFKSGSFKRGDFSARRGSPEISGSAGFSSSSKKFFKGGSSGGSRGFSGFRHGNGGGGFKIRSR